MFFYLLIPILLKPEVMKKSFRYILAAAFPLLLAVSCQVEPPERSGRDSSNLESLSLDIFYNGISTPLNTFVAMLSLDRYLYMTDAGSEDYYESEYWDENLHQSGENVYETDFGTVCTGSGSLTEPGVMWRVSTWNGIIYISREENGTWEVRLQGIQYNVHFSISGLTWSEGFLSSEMTVRGTYEEYQSGSYSADISSPEGAVGFAMHYENSCLNYAEEYSGFLHIDFNVGGETLDWCDIMMSGTDFAFWTSVD